MKLANIVSSDKIIISDDFNLLTTINDIIVGLPTLIIGYDYVNKNYPDFDITDRLLDSNLYWTFKRTEKRDKFEEDLRWFTQKAYMYAVKDITYIFIDPIQHKRKTLIKIIKKIYTSPMKITYLIGDMFFIYIEKFIFGVDLKLLNYLGLNIDKIKTKIKTNSSVFLDNDSILIEYSKVVELLGNKSYYTPYLYYLRNEEKNTNTLIFG